MRDFVFFKLSDFKQWNVFVKSSTVLRGIHIHLTTQNFNLTLWVNGWIKIESPWGYGQITCLSFSNKKDDQKNTYSSHYISQKSSFISYHFPYLAMLFSNFYHALSILKGRAEGTGEKPRILNVLYQVPEYLCIFKVFFSNTYKVKLMFCVIRCDEYGWDP